MSFRDTFWLQVSFLPIGYDCARSSAAKVHAPQWGYFLETFSTYNSRPWRQAGGPWWYSPCEPGHSGSPPKVSMATVVSDKSEKFLIKDVTIEVWTKRQVMLGYRHIPWRCVTLPWNSFYTIIILVVYFLICCDSMCQAARVVQVTKLVVTWSRGFIKIM